MIPVFEAPDLTGAQPLERVPDGFAGQVEAAWREQRHIANSNARQHFQDRIWDERLEEVERAAGVRLPHPRNPLDPRFITNRGTGFNLFGSAEGEGEGNYDGRVAYVEQQISTLLATRPELAGQIQTRDHWDQVMRSRAAEIFEDARDIGLVPALIGGAGASFTDPVNIMTLPVGGASKSVLTAAASEAGINALLEAANLPFESAWRNELGLDELTLEEAGTRIAAGGLFGGLIGGGGRAVEQLGAAPARAAWRRMPLRRQAEALRDLAPDDAEAKGLAGMLERQAEIEEANPFGQDVGAEAAHSEFMAWGREAAAGGEMSEANPWRRLERQPSVARDAMAEEDLFARADRIGAPLPDDIASLRQARAASLEQRDAWYDRTITDTEYENGSVTAFARTSDGEFSARFITSGDGRYGFGFELNGAHQRQSGSPTRESVARGQRTMTRAAVVLDRFLRRREPEMVTFSGDTPAHDRLYRSLLGRIDNEAYSAYKDAELFLVVRHGSDAEDFLARSGFARRIERRAPVSTGGRGLDAGGDRGSGRGPGVRDAEPARAGANQPARSELTPQRTDEIDEPGGAAAAAQVQQLRLELDAAPDELVPTGRVIDGEPELQSIAEMEEGLQREASTLASLRQCAIGGGAS